jgi:hypothetical protein
MSGAIDEGDEWPPNLLRDFPASRASKDAHERSAKLAKPIAEAIASRPTIQLWIEVQGAILERALLGAKSAFMPLRTDIAGRLRDLGYRLRFHRRDVDQEQYLHARVEEDTQRFTRALELLDQRSDVLKALFNQSAENCPAFLAQLDSSLTDPNACAVLIHRLSQMPLAQHLTLDRFEYLFEDAIQARRSFRANQARLEAVTELVAHLPHDAVEGHIVDWETAEPKCEKFLSDFWQAGHMAYVSNVAPCLVEEVVDLIRVASHEGESHVVLYLAPKDGEWTLLWDGSSDVSDSPSLAPLPLSFVLRAAGYGVIEKQVFPFGKPNQAAGSAHHSVTVYWSPAPQSRQHLLFKSF